MGNNQPKSHLTVWEFVPKSTTTTTTKQFAGEEIMHLLPTAIELKKLAIANAHRRPAKSSWNGLILSIIDRAIGSAGMGSLEIEVFYTPLPSDVQNTLDKLGFIISPGSNGFTRVSWAEAIITEV